MLGMLQISEESLQDDILKELNNTSAKSLTRKRRYLVFPTGSSFQLGKHNIFISKEYLQYNEFIRLQLLFCLVLM